MAYCSRLDGRGTKSECRSASLLPDYSSRPTSVPRRANTFGAAAESDKAARIARQSTPFSASALPTDYVKVLARARCLVVSIKVELLELGYTKERQYIQALLAAHDEGDQGVYEQLLGISSRVARDQFFAERFVRLVLEPAYFELPLRVKDIFLPRVEELQRMVTGMIAGDLNPWEMEEGDHNTEHEYPELSAAEIEALMESEKGPGAKTSESTSQSNWSSSIDGERKSFASSQTDPTQYDADEQSGVIVDRAAQVSDAQRAQTSASSPVLNCNPLYAEPPPARHLARRSVGFHRQPPPRDRRRTVPEADILHVAGLGPNEEQRVCDELNLTSSRREPTWDDIAQGRWPLPPHGLSPEPFAPEFTLTSLEFEHQSNLPLPPPLVSWPTPDGQGNREPGGEGPFPDGPLRKITEAVEVTDQRSVLSRRSILSAGSHAYAPSTASHPSLVRKYSWETASDVGTSGKVLQVEAGILPSLPSNDGDDDGDDDADGSEGDLERTYSGVHMRYYGLPTSQNDAQAEVSDATPNTFTIEALYGGALVQESLYTAIASFEAYDSRELSLAAGQVVRIVEKPSGDSGFPGVDSWWLAETVGVEFMKGWVPKTYLVQGESSRIHRPSSCDLPEVYNEQSLENGFGIESMGEAVIMPVVEETSSDQGTYNYDSLWPPVHDVPTPFQHDYDNYGDSYTYWFGSSPPTSLLNTLYGRLNRLFERYLRLSWLGPAPPALPIHEPTVSPEFVVEIDADEAVASSARPRPFAQHRPLPAMHLPPGDLLPAKISQSQSQLISAMFGGRLSSPGYYELGFAYASQLNATLYKAIQLARVPNLAAAVVQDGLLSLLILVARELQPDDTISNFVTTHGYLSAFRSVATDPSSISPPSNDPIELYAGPAGDLEGPGDQYPAPTSSSFHSSYYEWILFMLESYFLLPNTETPSAVTNTPICDLCEQLHPMSSLTPDGPSSFETTVTPAELSANVLNDVWGIKFEWTNDPSQHLHVDRGREHIRISLYGNVAFAYLHSLAKTDSSLHKNGFRRQHQALVEIAATYRLFFGHNEQSRTYFSEIDVKRRSEGFYDIFESLPRADTIARPHYFLNRDFPMYGERILIIKGHLKPTGLRGLWKDKRDSVQWYTFWAVVFLGFLGVVLGLIQMALSAIQAYASMEALKRPGRG